MENLIQTLVCQLFISIQGNDVIREEITREVKLCADRINNLKNDKIFPVDPLIDDVQVIAQSKKKIKILVVGHSVMNRTQIVSVFQQEFSRKMSFELPKKAIETPVLEYGKMKSFDLVKKIKSNKYDYIIAGQRPHSTANKGINSSLLGLKLKYNSKAQVTDYLEAPLNKGFLSQIAETVCEDWATRN